MGYVRIIIHLVDGDQRSGVRRFPEPMNLDDIRTHAWQLAGEVLGRGSIEDVIVMEVAADDPAHCTTYSKGQNPKLLLYLMHLFNFSATLMTPSYRTAI